MPRKTNTAKRYELARRAFDVIRERGLHRTTMSDVAAGLGMKRPTLYWYFADLGQIMNTMLEVLLAEQDEFLAERLADIDHPIDALGAFVRSTHEFYEGREDVVVMLFQLWSSGPRDEPNPVVARTRMHAEPRRQLAVQLVEQGIADGRVVQCDARELVELVSAVVDGVMLRHVGLGQDVEPVLDGLHTHVLAPLKVEPSTTPEEDVP